MIEEAGLRQIAWPWYTLIGSVICIFVGFLLSLRHKR